MAEEKPRNVFLTLSPNKATAEIGWHRRQSAYNDEYIDQIVDPSESVKKLLTAIPSPFARIHLVDSAFHFVNARDRQQRPKHEGNSVFHKLTSDCLDVLELLFSWNTVSTGVQTSYWSREELQKLNGSKGQELLASVLDLFLQQDAQTAKFSLQPSFIQLTIGHQTIALSSPLTLFITAPRAGEIASEAKLINPESGRPYFNAPVPLFKRSAEFQQYLHWLFHQNQVLRTSCLRMHRYMSDSIDLVADRALQGALRAIANGGVGDLGQQLKPVPDYRNMPLKVCGAELRQRNSEDIKARLRSSPLAIRSKRRPPRLDNPPLVLDGQSDSFGKQSSTMQLDLVLNESERILPDLGVRYPYLVASDLIDDLVIRLPYKLNAERFFLPDSRNLKASEYDYLPPLKPAFFEYFDVEDIAQITKFLPTSSGGIVFQVDVPTASGKVTFSKSFYESPEGTRRGRIVEAKMNCAVFPIVTTRNRPALSDRFWVMLVDAEIEPILRNQECFALKFYSRQNSGAQVPYTEIGIDSRAPQYVSTVRRSPKGDEASSTYYRIWGAPFDYIAVEAFPNDPGRRARGLIAPRWVDKAVGLQQAAVGIDFGTTNTHVAWIYEGEARPAPTPFTIGSGELQVALLSAPWNSATSESAKYDEFDSSLSGPLRIGTKARLHHEFLPSIVGTGGSAFSFPLRTATSEALNLQAGQYQSLMNVNIAFTFGREPKRRGEEDIHTNLKWSLQIAPEVEKRVEAFIEELLVMIRTKLILNNVDPVNSRVVWFRPLSFDHVTKNNFDKIWQTKVLDVLKNSQLRCITESEAPYYYHESAAAVITSRPTICVDIGGGSTDVVFFHQQKPAIGSSFSFAGNALWGAGYDEVGRTQTGVVQKYGPLMYQRIQQIENADEKRRIDGVYQELEGQPCEEIVNFFFAINKYVEFSKALSRDRGVLCLILLHYSAIMFHCAQVMHSTKMPEPEYICFSGRGARSLDILDPSSDHAQIATLTHALFEKVYGASIDRPMKILLAADSKEATCNGGVLKSPGDNSEPKPIVSVGDGKTIAEITYKQIDQATRDAVASNIATFADCLVELSRTLGFSRRFGVKEGDFEWIAAELKDKVTDYIEFGLKRHGYQANPTETVNETLFFYPLVQKLFEIGNRLVISDTAAKGGK